VCRKCNDVIHADADVLHRLDNELDELYGFHPDLDHFSIFGVCSECQVQ
jgi:Fur family ferric uptake transcriptional regulator